MMKIKFTEESLKDLEETVESEDMQEFIDELQKAVDDGSFFEDSEPVDMEQLKEEEPDLYEILMQRLEDFEDPTLN
jgi:DNA replication initiation complex subunit (GINS family)